MCNRIQSVLIYNCVFQNDTRSEKYNLNESTRSFIFVIYKLGELATLVNEFGIWEINLKQKNGRRGKAKH